MIDYIKDLLLQDPNNSIKFLRPFFEDFEYYGIFCSILILMISILVAKQDFRSWHAYLRIYPNYLLVCIAVSALFYNIIYSLMPLQIYNGWIIVFFLWVICGMWYYIVKREMSKDILKIINDINDFELLEHVVNSFNMKICLNDNSKCDIKKISDDVYRDILNIDNQQKIIEAIKLFLDAIDKLKNNKKYLKDEDPFILNSFVFYLRKYNPKDHFASSCRVLN